MHASCKVNRNHAFDTLTDIMSVTASAVPWEEDPLLTQARHQVKEENLARLVRRKSSRRKQTTALATKWKLTHIRISKTLKVKMWVPDDGGWTALRGLHQAQTMQERDPMIDSQENESANDKADKDNKDNKDNNTKTTRKQTDAVAARRPTRACRMIGQTTNYAELGEVDESEHASLEAHISEEEEETKPKPKKRAKVAKREASPQKPRRNRRHNNDGDGDLVFLP
uniref:Uncharacterized protein n=1 Tax=Vitrella brassicaformis TaxID=1169539 RepID=A0A7S1K310_9ALVE|mmetsp:Transcript_35658/g.88709  ORF Transcript_35658/g.88709 Transcript_35658/m.88709 type:complete len:226 (+) Transcript_35658:942-1619(+)